MRAVVGLSEIVWYYRNLREGFEELGIGCWQVNLDDYVTFDVVSDSNLFLARVARKTNRLRRRTKRNQIVRKSLIVVVDTVARTLLFVSCLARCDVFVLGAGTSFVHPREGAILRAFGKKIVRIFHGGDERPFYANGSFTTGAAGMSIEEGMRKTQRLRSRLRIMDRYANAIVSNPLSSHLHDRDVVIYQRIGNPFRPPVMAAPEEKKSAGTLRVLHSPSDETAKGSQLIRDAVDRVKAKGYALELVELVNVPNARVMDELANCDFVIDQAYSDTPMSGFATEAAALGKAVIVGGYGWTELESIIPREQWPPTECCLPDEMDVAIERLASDAAYRHALGCRARDFVLTAWSCREVASRLLRICEDDIPSEWFFSPDRLRYTGGCGMSEDRARQVLQHVLGVGSVEALQLERKPELETQYLAFASGH